MSRVRFTKIASPSNPPPNTAEVYFDTAGPGYNTPVALAARDENGNIANLGNFLVLSYRFLKKTIVTTTGAGTWTPANGCRLAVVTCVGGGGGGGAAGTSSTQTSCGGGGGAGGVSISTLVTAAIKSTSYSVGALGAGGTSGNPGTAGSAGGDTTWDTTVIVAKGGSGGTYGAAGTTSVNVAGGVGGLAASGTGDIKISGGNGHSGQKFNTVLAFGGDGAGSPLSGGAGGAGGGCPTTGIAGGAASAGQWGAGGGGAATSTTTQVGGAGICGCIIIDEYA